MAVPGLVWVKSSFCSFLSMAFSATVAAVRVGIRSHPSKPRSRLQPCAAGCPINAITLSPPTLGSGSGPGLERRMADHGEVEYATAMGNDYPAHEETYRNFITLVKVTMAVIVVIVLGMAYFLT